VGLAVIPDDWAAGYVSLCVDWPDSPDWLAILRGLLTSPHTEEFWDKFTGTPSDALAAIMPTFQNNLHPEACMGFQTGMMLMWPQAAPPAGWLFWNGDIVLKADYPALWEFFDPLWEESETEFRLGPTESRFPASFSETSNWALDLETFGGEIDHTLNTDEMPSHNHTQNSHNHTQDSHNHTQDSHNHTQNAHTHAVFATTVALAAGGVTIGRPTLTTGNDDKVSGSATPTNQAATPTNQATTPTNQAATPTNQASGDGQSHNNLPPFFVTNFIIKT